MKRGIDVRGRTDLPSGFANVSEYRAVNVETAIQKQHKFPAKLSENKLKLTITIFYLTYSIISCIIVRVGGAATHLPNILTLPDFKSITAQLDHSIGSLPI